MKHKKDESQKTLEKSKSKKAEHGNKKFRDKKYDIVDEASIESFPASDAPAYK